MKFAFLNILISILIAYYIQAFLISDNLIYNFYSSQLSYEQIENLLFQQKKWQWIGYIIIPVIYLLKILAISFCVYTGFFLSLGNRVKYSVILEKVILADFVFLTPTIIKIIWFSFQNEYSLEDIQFFMPGSLLNFFDPGMVDKWLVYPLQAFNIFEVGFWLFLAYELKIYYENDFSNSLQLVALSYGSGFLIWVVFIIFLTINLS
jgi:hypothetical protein